MSLSYSVVSLSFLSLIYYKVGIRICQIELILLFINYFIDYSLIILNFNAFIVVLCFSLKKKT
jgi:hypothetical protein